MKLLSVLFLITFVFGIELPIFNEKAMARIHKRDACSGSCVDAAKAEVNKCKFGQANPSDQDLVAEFNCLCNLPDSFFNDLSDCIKNCDQVDQGGLDGFDSSPSGLRQLYCDGAASFSSLVQEFSGTLPTAYGGAAAGIGGGLGGFATQDVGAAETDTGAGGNGGGTDTGTGTGTGTGTHTGTNTDTHTDTHTTNTNTHTTNTTGTTNGNGSAAKTDTSETSKTDTSTKETSHNAASTMGVCSIIYLVIFALI